MDELEDLKKTDPNATIIVGGNANGAIQFVFLCTGQMREDFEKYPEILCIDNTYNTNKNKMPLTVFICVDGEGHGRVAGYCFVASEERHVLRDSVGSFCEVYASSIPKTTLVMVDKDPNQIAIIVELMTHVRIYICRFHCTHIFKRQLKTYDANKDNLKILSKMLYADTKEEYDMSYEELRQNVPDAFMAYFEEYWHDTDLVWKGHERHFSTTFGVTATNVVESHHAKIKKLLNRRRSLGECVRYLRLQHRNKNMQTRYENFVSHSKVSYVVDNSSPDVSAIVNSCTKYTSNISCF